MTSRRTRLWLWGSATAMLVLFMLIGGVQFSAELSVVLLVFVLLLFVFSLVLGVLLALTYSEAWRSWFAWLILLAIVTASGALSQSGLPIGFLDVRAAASLSLVGSGAALITALGLTLWRYDIGLPLIAWLSLGLIWGAMFWWQSGTDFVLAMVSSLGNINEPSPIFWPSVLVTAALCLSPFALLSVMLHFWWLWRRELRREPLPAAPGSVET